MKSNFFLEQDTPWQSWRSNAAAQIHERPAKRRGKKGAPMRKSGIVDTRLQTNRDNVNFIPRNSKGRGYKQLSACLFLDVIGILIE